MDLRSKRIYAPAATQDGFRILVDRLWPRGCSKERAALDLWLKEVAPSPSLRRWFGHEPERWDEFRIRYIEELAAHPQHVAPIIEHAKSGRVTLLFGAKDETRNHALLLADYIRFR
jgi:uncharacterized protein YeaO (DUF488 family)